MPFAGERYPAALFLSFPNVDSLLLVIDDDHLRGIFAVFDVDHRGESNVFPLPVFACDRHGAIRVDVILAADLEIRGRTRPRRGPVAALANVALHLETAKRNGFVVLPVVPDAFECTVGYGVLGECTS